jgi:hypothetical protein
MRILRASRGYGEDRELFIDFPGQVAWIRAILHASELAIVRYMEPGGHRAGDGTLDPVSGAG